MRKATRFRWLALALAVLSSVLLLEVVLRVSPIWIGRNSDTMFLLMEYSQTLGWRMKPSIRETLDFVDVQGIPVRSNTAGFWDDEFPGERKPGGPCRIVFLGDSFTWGYGVREEERFSNVLRGGDPTLETLNFGMAGYGTDQALLVWRHVAVTSKPDLVVLTVHTNDYRENVSVVRWGLSKPYFELQEDGSLAVRNVPVDPDHDYWRTGIFHRVADPYRAYYVEPVARRSRVLHWTLRHSSAARLAYTATRRRPSTVRGRPRSESRVDPQSDQPLERTPSADSPAKKEIEVLDALVQALAEEVRATGARFLVVLATDSPRRYPLHRTTWDSAGISHLDATTEPLRRRFQSDSQPVYYRYNQHWTADAHRAVAELLAERIAGTELCPALQEASESPDEAARSQST